MVEANESAATAHINELVSHLLAKKYKCKYELLEAPKDQVLADLIAAVSKCTGLERSKIEATKVMGNTEVYYEGGHLNDGEKPTEKFQAFQDDKIHSFSTDLNGIKNQADYGGFPNPTLKCKNGHEVLKTTVYPSGYPIGGAYIICSFCKKNVTCANGYYRCDDDGKKCEDDWCTNCAEKQIAEKKSVQILTFICSKCTFENQLDKTNCEMCETKRPNMDGIKHGLGIIHTNQTMSWYGGCEENLYWKWQVYNEGEEIHSFTIDEYHYDK